VTVDDLPEEVLVVLRDALEDDEPLVREHTAWALGQTSGGDEKSERGQAQSDPLRVVGENSRKVGSSEAGAGVRVELSALCAENSERTGPGTDHIQVVVTMLRGRPRFRLGAGSR
jgi:hypothetical protein